MKYKNTSNKIITFVDSKLNIHSFNPGEVQEHNDEEFYIPGIERVTEEPNKQ